MTVLRAVAAVILIGAAGIGCSFDTTAGQQSCEESERDEDGKCEDDDGIGGDAGADAGGIEGDDSADTATSPSADTGRADAVGEMVDACDPPTEACGDASSACEPGMMRPCYTGPDGTGGVGACREGTETCNAEGEWGDCEGETTPTDEQCGDDRDNDCDGVVDEADVCKCNYDGKSEGVCSRGRLDGQGNCEAPPAYEESEISCDDGLDNDCNEETDNGDDSCEEIEEQEPGESCEDDEDCRSRCIGGTCAHRVFVTSQGYRGDFGGVSGGDRRCGTRAQNQGARGTWKAILSDSGEDAIDRLDISAPIVRWDGTKVADGENDLWDIALDAPIEVTEQGNVIDVRVWTGTNADGSRDGSNQLDSGEYCDDWTAVEHCRAGTCWRIDGEAGWSGRDTNAWTFGNPDPGCDEQHHLYCIDGQ